MANSKTSMIKTALHAAMAKAAPGAASSRSAVNAVKLSEEGKRAIEAERDEILDHGLMVIAGRVAARPVDVNGQGELFSEGRFKEFTDLRQETPGSAATARTKSTKITMESWFSQPSKPVRDNPTHRTNEDIVDAYFRKMKAEGLPPATTLGEYLGVE